MKKVTKATKATKDESARLAALVAKLGGATEAEVVAAVGAVEVKALIAEGADVVTTRVSSDAAAIYGAAAGFFATADEALQKKVRLDPAVLRIGAWAALEGDRLFRGFRSQGANRAAHAKATATTRDQAVERARTERDGLAEAIIAAVGADSATLARVRRATQPGAAGHVDTTPDVAITSLVAIAREVLDTDDAAVATRCGLFRLDADYVDACEATAAATRAAITGAHGAADGRATLATIDRWDGLNLWLLRRVVNAFEAGHARDGRVPRMQVQALRGVLTSKPKRKVTTPAAEPPGAGAKE